MKNRNKSAAGIKNSSESNERFKELGHHVVSGRWFYIGLTVILTIFAGSGLSKIKFDTSVENWFNRKSQIFDDKKRFEKIFGNSDVIGIHLEADDVFSPDILIMLDSLGQDLEREVPFVDKVTSLADMEYTYSKGEEIITEDLVPDDFEESDLNRYRKRALAKESLSGKIISKDCTETWLIIDLLPYPGNWEENHGSAPENLVGEKVLDILSRDKYGAYDLRAVGTPIYGYEELQFTNEESLRLLGITLLVLLIFLVLFFRSFSGVLIPFITTIISIVLVYGLMGHLQIKVNAFLFSVPIVLSLAVSLGYFVHLYNYFKHAFKESVGRPEAVAIAVGKSGWPTTFAAFTTIGALGSFLAISLVPIRWLGATSAAMVLVVFVVVFFLSAALLSFGKRYSDDSETVKTKGQRVHSIFDRIGYFALNNTRSIMWTTLVVALVLLSGILKLEVNINAQNSYGMKVPYVKRMLEVAGTDIGSFDSYNISINLGEQNKVKDPVVLKKFEIFTDSVKQLELTKRTSSVLSILKDMNRLVHGDKPEYYRIPEEQNLTAQLLMIYEMSGGSKLYDWVSDDFSELRLQVDINNLDAKETMYEIKMLRRWSEELFPGTIINISGGMPEYAVLNQYVAVGQIKSLGLAFAVIGILMMIVFKGIRIGLIGLLPNVFSVLVVGGLMGWLGIPLDFVTVTIAPMILGLAVDDTIHFVTHYRQILSRTGDYAGSVIETLKVVGRAMLTTSVIIIIAFVVYLTSPFNMMVFLGVFVMTGIFSAMVANLVLLPALMKLFEK
jgi:predicted RND superfamily exporter protein